MNFDDLSFLSEPEHDPKPEPQVSTPAAAPMPEPAPEALESPPPVAVDVLDFMGFAEPSDVQVEAPEAIPDSAIDNPIPEPEPEPELSIANFVKQMDSDELSSYHFEAAPKTLNEYQFRLESLREMVLRKAERKAQVQQVFDEFSQFMTDCRMFYLLTKELEKASKIVADLNSKFEETPALFWWKKQRLEAAAFKAKTAAGHYKKRWLADDKGLRAMAEELTEKALQNSDLGVWPKHIGQNFRLRHQGTDGGFDKASALILQEAQENVSWAVCWHEMAVQNLTTFEATHGHMVAPGGVFADEIAAETIAAK